jgi:anthranilate synthase component 2
MILLIDNYDSFTYNLLHLIGGLGYEVEVRRNDALTANEALAMKPQAIVLSPGPCTPDDAGICLDLVEAANISRTPLFGVCLGMQSIAQCFGAKIVRAGKLMHGKTSAITHKDHPVFSNVPQGFTATRYHSLIAATETIDENELSVLATSDDDGEIMALAHRTAPIAGVQFHPESIASENGATLFANFMAWTMARTMSGAAAVAEAKS